MNKELGILINTASKDYMKISAANLNYIYEKNIFSKKKAREKTKHNYEIALKRNIIFFLYKWDYSLNLVYDWIINGIPNDELAVKQLDRIWDNSATSNIGDIIILRNGRPLTEEMRDIIKRYDSISIEEDRIEELEYSYKVASIRDKMLVKLINLSINTNNRKIVNAAFSSGSPQEVVSFINNELYELSKIALMEKWC